MTEAIEKSVSIDEKRQWIVDNMRLVDFFVRKYAGDSIDFDELRGMATLALVIGADQRFDPHYQNRCKDSTLVNWRLIDQIRKELSTIGNPEKKMRIFGEAVYI